ncbi:unnamed protein product [Fraxinus pennsylvanica]|uniref:Uncharacterized protein n=1 Tax=Fraxinus pennsylvanica TaxID=56036 RepID=A0AAD2DQX3_9LAMI|nr:unnamed protein product [Fraxinus pennsylvanica]
MRAINVAIADAIVTCLWFFCPSLLDVLTFVVASALGVSQGLPTHLVSFFVCIRIYWHVLGGATFNPTGHASFYASGVGGAESLVTAAVRFPAQLTSSCTIFMFR